jgi:hypothetical protein
MVLLDLRNHDRAATIEIEVMYRFRSPVGVREILDLNRRSWSVHGCSILLVVFIGTPLVVEHGLQGIVITFPRRPPGKLFGR